MSDTIPEEVTELAQRIVAKTDYEHNPQKRTELVAAALLSAEKRGEQKGMERERALIESVLSDPIAVRANILRGGIARPDDLVWLHDTNGPVALALAAAEKRGEERGLRRAAEIVASYPPDDFFNELDAATEEAYPGNKGLAEFRVFMGDAGNWAYFMSLLMKPYAAAILSQANEGA